MTAYTIVHGWAIERAAELRKAADKAERAYTKDPFRECCALYASGLRRAATDLEETARVIIACATSPKGERSRT